jgi:hypothetical protein
VISLTYVISLLDARRQLLSERFHIDEINNIPLIDYDCFNYNFDLNAYYDGNIDRFITPKPKVVGIVKDAKLEDKGLLLNCLLYPAEYEKYKDREITWSEKRAKGITEYNGHGEIKRKVLLNEYEIVTIGFKRSSE